MLISERNSLRLLLGSLGLVAEAEELLLLLAVLLRLMQGRERRGRRAWSEPATMPMPSSITDQRPILPVLNINSAGLL